MLCLLHIPIDMLLVVHQINKLLGISFDGLFRIVTATQAKQDIHYWLVRFNRLHDSLYYQFDIKEGKNLRILFYAI